MVSSCDSGSRHSHASHSLSVLTLVNIRTTSMLGLWSLYLSQEPSGVQYQQGFFASCLWNGLYWDCRLSSSVISDFNHAALKFPPTNVLEYLGVILVDGFDAYTWRRRHIIGIMHLSLLNCQLICKQSDFFIINYLYVYMLVLTKSRPFHSACCLQPSSLA